MIPVAQKQMSNQPPPPQPSPDNTPLGQGRYLISVKTSQKLLYLDPTNYHSVLSQKFIDLNNRAIKESNTPKPLNWKKFNLKTVFRQRPGRAQIKPNKIINYVTYELHPDFDNNLRHVKEIPYETSDCAYGSFYICVQIMFKKKAFGADVEKLGRSEQKNRIVEVQHYLNIDEDYDDTKSIEHNSSCFIDNPGVDFHNMLEKSGIDYRVESVPILKPKKEKKKKKNKSEKAIDNGQNANFKVIFIRRSVGQNKEKERNFI